MTFRPRALLVAALLAGTGCEGLRVPLADPQPTDWAQDGGDAARTSATDAAFRPPLREAWRTGVEAAFGPASALVLGEVIAVGTRRGEVILLSAETGKRLGRVSLGEAVEGGLARAGDALLVPVDKGKRGLERLVPARGEGETLVRGSLLASVLALEDGQVVAASGRSTLALYAPDRTAPVWTAAVGPGRLRAGALATDGLVVAGDDSGALVGLDAVSGAERWRRTLGAPFLERPAAGALLYVPTPRGRLLALRPETGAERWRFALPDTTVRIGPPAVDGAALVLVSTDGHVRLLDAATGAVQWQAVLDGTITAAPLLTSGYVFVGTHRKKLVALDRQTGAVAWEATLRGRVKSAVAAGAGCIVVLTDARDVLCFRPEAALAVRP